MKDPRCACGKPALVLVGQGKKAHARVMDDHPLCSRCHRSEREAHHARLRKETGTVLVCDACGARFERRVHRCPCGSALRRTGA